MTSGMLPGAALGLSAGILIALLNRAHVLLEEEYGRGRNVDDDDLSTDGLDPSSSAAIRDGGGDGPIPDDIRAMSNEELARSIEILRGRGDHGGGWVVGRAFKIEGHQDYGGPERGCSRFVHLY